MAETHNFEHLRLLRRYLGPALLPRGGSQSPQTRANKNASQAHSQLLATASQALTTNWQERKELRQANELPAIPKDIPILLEVDPGLDLDILREKFAFEIVAEQEEGYVIVASEDIELAPFLAMVKGFAVQVRGSATIAQVRRLFDDPDQTNRLRRILSDYMFALWPNIKDDGIYFVDVGIACTGTQEIPTRPKRGTRATDADWAKKELEHKVNHPRFHQHFAVHETEAWLLSDLDIFPPAIRGDLPKTQKPETVNHRHPPSHRLKDIYHRRLARKYSKPLDGASLFRQLNPQTAYNRCPHLKLLLDDILTLATGTQ